MPKPSFKIRFRGNGGWPVGCDSKGNLLDAMTGEPKRFGSSIAATHYGKLSFGPVSREFRYATFDVVKLGD